MSARNSLEPGRREWVLLNLGIGCTTDSLISEMIRDGFEPSFALAFVESFAKPSTSGPPPCGHPGTRSNVAVLAKTAPDWKELYQTELVVGVESPALTSGPGNVRPQGMAPVLDNNPISESQGVTGIPDVARRPAAKDSPNQMFVSEPSRVIGKNVIQTSDRKVHVITRLRNPDLIVLANVLSPEECDELVRLSVPKIKRSLALNSESGKVQIMEDRTSQGTFFHVNENEFISRLERRIAELTGSPVENGECLQIFKYDVGGEYRPHFDFFEPGHPATPKQIETGGQRVATLIMYLNDVEEGGTTDFPNIGLSVSPRKGNAVYFSYLNSLGQLNRATYHAGAPVQKGEKWIASNWIRKSRWTLTRTNNQS